MAWLFGKKKNQKEETESTIVVDTNVKVEDTKDLNPSTIKSKLINIYRKLTNNPFEYSNRSIDYYGYSGYTFPPLNFDEIRLAVEKEPYLKRSINRFVELIWKGGYNITGKNLKAVKYIKRRLKEIAFISNKPTLSLFEEITRELITYANVFVQKVRDKNASSGKEISLFGKTLQPIAAYNILKTANVAIESKKLNIIDNYVYKIPKFNIEEWLDNNPAYQRVKGSSPILYQGQYISLTYGGPDGSQFEKIQPHDMIHIYTEKKLNGYYGNPHILGVLDDCRALRRIEETVETLIFQHCIPLLHVQVGNDQTGSTQQEIDDAVYVFENMLSEGLAVTSHRYKVEAINTHAATMDVIPYLEYFKLRITTGMGHSLVSIGESGQSSRATAEVLNESVTDMAKRYQRTLEEFITMNIFNELLVEGGFNPFSDFDEVKLSFKEINDDLRHKADFQTMQMYQGGVITLDEARERMGYMPLPPSEKKNLFQGEQSPQTKQAASQSGGNKNQHSDSKEFKYQLLDYTKQFLEDNYNNKNIDELVNKFFNDFKVEDEQLKLEITKTLTENFSKGINANTEMLCLSKIEYLVDVIC